MLAWEIKLRNLLDNTLAFLKASEEDESLLEKSKKYLEEADSIIISNTRESFNQVSPEVILKFIETSLKFKDKDAVSERYLDLFFQNYTNEDQFFCRALFSSATVHSRKIDSSGIKGEENLATTLQAFSYIQRAIEIITKSPENKQRYQFLIYNASICTWNIIRPLMKPGWVGGLVSVIERLSNLLEEMDDVDYNWRCRYLQLLTNAMLDADKKPEALKIYDKLWDMTKKKGETEFQEFLFRMRIHLYRDNNNALAALKKEAETAPESKGLRSLFVLQQIKSGVILDNQVEKELTAVMAILSPASVAVNDNDPKVAASSSKISPINQDRLAEAGRIAIKYNLIRLCEGSVNVVSRANQGSLRAKIWNEYNKAELILKKPRPDVHPKTGMKLNSVQKQIEEFEFRIEVLKLLDRAMVANKRLVDPDLIIEGCVLIWNTGLPLLKKSMRSHTYKPYLTATGLLEQIQANENALRVSLHLELAKYEIDQDFLSKALVQVKKALSIDYSVALKKLQIPSVNPEEEDLSNYQRPYDKYLKLILQKLELKTNLYGGEPETALEQIVLDIENSKSTKNIRMKESLLGKAIKDLSNIEQEIEENGEEQYQINPELNLVEEEIKEEARQFKYKKIEEKKQRVLLAAEIAKLSYEENLLEISLEAAKLGIKTQWDAVKNIDLVIAQAECYYIISQIHIEYLLEEDIEIGYTELITIEEDQDERDFSQEDKAKVLEWKLEVVNNVKSGVKAAMSVKQSWLVFNGAIILWNNFLPVFKKINFQPLVLPEVISALEECFESMNSCFIESDAPPKNQIKDYDIDTKINIFANLSVVFAKMLEFNGKNDAAVRVCDVLLQKQLPSSLKKAFDSIKAKITKSVATQAKAPAAAKGAPVQQSQVNAGDLIISEISSMIELISTNKDNNQASEMLKKAIDQLSLWRPNELEEIDLELHAELWCKLGTNQMIKFAIVCAETAYNSLTTKKVQKEYLNAPYSRLRWYSVAHTLYGEALSKIVDKEKQEKESQEKLLFMAIDHFMESANIASKAAINSLLLEAAKFLWNTAISLLDKEYNRKKLIMPMATVAGYLRECRENGDPDFLVLYYSGLFACITENKEWKLGENIVESAFDYIPVSHQRVLWETKMLYLSKLGKNVLHAISNMKEGNASLQAKVWVKFARSSANQFEQYSAFNKAIDILKKDNSIEIVEVIIEFSEWLHRNKYQSQDVEDQLLLAVDTLMDIESGWDDEDEEAGEDDEHKTRKTGKSGASRTSHQRSMMSKQTKKTNTKRGSMLGSQAGRTSSMKSKKTVRKSTISRTSNKTKQTTKTSLSKRQDEDPQPMFLNCTHYDKLFRIHSMLSMISKESKKQRGYALDAHFFLIKILEQTYQAFSALEFLKNNKQEIEQLGYNPSDPNSKTFFYNEVFTNTDINVPSVHLLPEKNDLWIDYDIPEGIINECKTHEDKVMLNKWVFHKPELTYFHILNVLKLLENSYMHIQMIPLLKIMALYCNIVLEQNQLASVFMLKLARIMYNMGYQEQGHKMSLEARSNLQLTPMAKKLAFDNIKGLKDASTPNDSVNFEPENTLDPFVLDALRSYQIWHEIGQELYKWGYILESKEYFSECQKHCIVLKDRFLYAWSTHYLAQIACLEGDYISAIKGDMMCHQTLNNPELLEESILQTSEHLLRLNKVNECKGMINDSIKMFESLASSQDSEQSLVYLLMTLYCKKAFLYLYDCRDAKTNEISEKALEEAFKQLNIFEALVKSRGCMMKHIILAIDFSKALFIEVYQKQAQVSDNKADLINKINQTEKKLERAAKLLMTAQEQLTEQLYYIGIGAQENTRNDSMSLPILRLLAVVKIKLAMINNQIGVIKNNIKVNISRTNKTDNDNKLEGIVANWMDTISKQIDALSKPTQKRMNRYEKSISMLNSSINFLHVNSNEYLEALVEIARSKRLLAVNKKHIKGIWKQEALDIEMDTVAQMADGKIKIKEDEETVDNLLNYKNEALKSFIEIKESETDIYNRIRSSLSDHVLDDILAKYTSEYAECRGNIDKEQSFELLSMYQFSVSRYFLLNVYKQSCKWQHKDQLQIQLLQQINKTFAYQNSPYLPSSHAKPKEDLETNSNAYKLINTSHPFDYLKENLPHSSAYLSLQFSQDNQQLYVSFMKINKHREFDYYLTKLIFTEAMSKQLDSIIERLKILKNYMSKTPIVFDNDYEKIINEGDAEFRNIVGELQMFFKPVEMELNEIINPPISEENKEAETVAAGGKKEDPKKAAAASAPKKGGTNKDELAKYESNLPLPTSGIESLILLLDTKLMELPFEALNLFSKIPVISRDFSLHLYASRLKALKHNALLHNNPGVSKDLLKYVYDIPSENDNFNEASASKIIEQHGKLIPSSKWEGIDTGKNHIPSIGEWQRFFISSDMFTYFAIASLLHKFTPLQLCEITNISKCKVAIVIDRMNTLKNFVKRDLECEKVAPISHQPSQTVALLSLIGINSIFINRLSVRPQENQKFLLEFIKEAGSGVYLGASARKYKESLILATDDNKLNISNYIYYFNNLCFGVPLVRIV